MPNIEIAICTWNRADSLSKTLDSICRNVIPDSCAVKLIVINNASTDDTAKVLADFASPKFSLQIVDEPKQGHSICRNAAIDAAAGDFLVWTDDDVLVSPTWLVSYVSAFEQQRNASFWGGPIHPLLPPNAPDWVAENMESLKGCFAHRDLGPKPIQFKTSLLPYGANFAVRTSVQKQFRFDEQLGRKGGGLDGGEETEMLRRLLRENHIGYWVPEASLQHAISSTRLTEEWMRGYFVGQGRALVRAEQAWSRSTWWLRAMARYHDFRYRSTRPKSPSPAWLAHLIRGSLAAGQAEAQRTN